ncbi:MAG: hypothetical protein AAF587_44510, partial [Bacteroidota bacterium]
MAGLSFDARNLEHLPGTWTLTIAEPQTAAFINQRIVDLYKELDGALHNLGFAIRNEIDHINDSGTKVYVGAKEKFLWVDDQVSKIHAAFQALQASVNEHGAQLIAQGEKIKELQDKMKSQSDWEKRLMAVEKNMAKAASIAAVEKLSSQLESVETNLDVVIGETLAGNPKSSFYDSGPVGEGIESTQVKKEDVPEMNVGPKFVERSAAGMQAIGGGPGISGLGVMDTPDRGDLGIGSLGARGVSSSEVPGSRLPPVHESPSDHRAEDDTSLSHPTRTDGTHDHRLAAMRTGGSMSGVEYYDGHARGGTMHGHAAFSNPVYGRVETASTTKNPKIDKPEKFSGDSDNANVGLWCRMCRRYGEANNMTSMSLLHTAVSLLRGSAALWYDQVEYSIRDGGFEAFERGLKAQFQYIQPEMTATDRLNAMKFVAGEDFMAFSKKFRENLLGLRNCSEREKLGYFLRAMPADVLQFVRLHMGLNPPLEEVLHRLQSVASLQMTSGTVSGSMIPSLIKKASSNSQQTHGNGSSYTNRNGGNGGHFGRNRGSYGNRGRGRGGGRGGRSGDSHHLNAVDGKSPRKGKTC